MIKLILKELGLGITYYWLYPVSYEDRRQGELRFPKTKILQNAEKKGQECVTNLSHRSPLTPLISGAAVLSDQPSGRCQRTLYGRVEDTVRGGKDARANMSWKNTAAGEKEEEGRGFGE